MLAKPNPHPSWLRTWPERVKSEATYEFCGFLNVIYVRSYQLREYCKATSSQKIKHETIKTSHLIFTIKSQVIYTFTTKLSMKAQLCMVMVMNCIYEHWSTLIWHIDNEYWVVTMAHSYNKFLLRRTSVMNLSLAGTGGQTTPLSFQPFRCDGITKPAGPRFVKLPAVGP